MFLTIVLVLTMVIGGVFALTNPQDYHDEHRIAGRGDHMNRYGTSYEVAMEKYDQADTVIIVRGDSVDGNPQVVDALSASGLAGVENAPILLTPQNRLHEATIMAIDELGAEKAIIVGGTQAISDGVKTELEGLLNEVVRVTVDGGNRYTTAGAVAEEVLAVTEADTAIIAGGTALVDSLVAGPLAHEEGYPILLVDNNVPQATEDIINNYGIENLIVVGGTAVVSESVFEDLENLVTGTVERVAGDDEVGRDRYGTSIRFAERFFDESEGVSLVNGYSFVDAVPASVLGWPIVYVEQDDLRDDVRVLLEGKRDFKVIGGTAVIADSVLEEARQIIETVVEEKIAIENVALTIDEKHVTVDGEIVVENRTISEPLTWLIEDEDENTVRVGQEVVEEGDFTFDFHVDKVGMYTLVMQLHDDRVEIDFVVEGLDLIVDPVSVDGNELTITGEIAAQGVELTEPLTWSIEDGDGDAVLIGQEELEKGIFSLDVIFGETGDFTLVMQLQGERVERAFSL